MQLYAILEIPNLVERLSDAQEGTFSVVAPVEARGRIINHAGVSRVIPSKSILGEAGLAVR